MAELSLQEIPNKTSGIYKLTNPNGSVYIGQSWNIKNRIKTYRSLDCKKQPKLYNSLIKYGFDSHKVEILCELPFDLSQDVMNEFERTYWLFFNECNFNMLNLKEPGSNGKYSEESRKKMGKHRIGVAPWNKGLKNPYSEETIKSMSESSKTEKKKEHILKLIKSNIGRKQSEEVVRKRSKAMEGKNGKMIIDVSNGFFFESIKEASEVYGYDNKKLMWQIYSKGFYKNLKLA
jgi:group I intron endonuclease